jgi:hypothetical protein
VGGRIGNESEIKYAEFSAKIFKDNDLSAVPAVRAWFENSLLSEDEFLASFVNLSYENKSERNTIRYVFDRLVNDGVKDGQSLDLLDVVSAQSGIRPSFDIEHLIPQSQAGSEEHRQLVNSIGNLIVIPKQINGILGNKSFREKMAVLGKPHKYPNNIKNVPSYLQQFVAEYGQVEWNAAAIRQRGETLGRDVFKVLSTRSAYK